MGDFKRISEKCKAALYKKECGKPKWGLIAYELGKDLEVMLRAMELLALDNRPGESEDKIEWALARASHELSKKGK
jgi:hypothetical protein